MTPRKAIRRTWLRRKSRKSRVLTRTGRVILDSRGISALRLAVYERAEGRCEKVKDGKRCNRVANWSGWKHGELRHIVWRSHGGSDTAENTQWNCWECHNAEHQKNEGRVDATARQDG